MHGEAFAFVPRNPVLSCRAALPLTGDTLKRLKSPQSRKKPVIVAGVTEILVILSRNQFFNGRLICTTNKRNESSDSPWRSHNTGRRRKKSSRTRGTDENAV